MTVLVVPVVALVVQEVVLTKGMSKNIESDRRAAEVYLSKIQHSKDRGIEFNMPLISFLNITKAQKCHYTGLPVDNNSRTIDRIDSSKGYVKGNVVCCHKIFNSFKSIIEDPQNKLDLDNALRGLTKFKKCLEERENEEVES